jgi:citrate synthase
VAPAAVGRIAAASGVPIQACVAAGIITIGDIQGGAGQEVAKKLGEWVVEAGRQGKSLAEIAETTAVEARQTRERVDGFGHPLHPRGDDRVNALGAVMGGRPKR